MNYKALNLLVNDWLAIEGDGHRWSNVHPRALIHQLLKALKTSEEAYDRIAQRCDPAGDTQMLHEARERAEAMTIQLRKTETIVRELCRDLGYAHVDLCRRQHYKHHSTVWNAAGCSRCRGEQMLEDLRITFEAEERSHD